jgi:hypothetical protein
MFNINDKVVCVDDSLPEESDYQLPPPSSQVVKDQVYVVRGISKWRSALLLVGIEGALVGKHEVGWRPSRFRLVSEVQAENRVAKKQKQPKP